MKHLNLLHVFVAGASIPPALGFSAAPSLQSLLATHKSEIASLKDAASKISNDDAVAPSDDVFYLRYVVSDAYADADERIAALESNMRWRAGEGKDIVTSARGAVLSATEGGGKWDNGPVQEAAPHSGVINEYLTSVQCITTSVPSTGDLVYCVRAGKIDDNALMSAVSVDDMVEFFLFAKEVNSAVADMRSLETDKLVMLVTINDLQGVKLVGGSTDLRKSLSAASKKATELYPSLNGRTLMLNLPALLGALVKVFTPLFPEAVRKRLRFESGPLKGVADMKEIALEGPGRDEFVEQVERLAYGD